MPREGYVPRGPEIMVVLDREEFMGFRDLTREQKGWMLAQVANEAIPVGEPQVQWGGFSGYEFIGDKVIVKGWGRTR